MNNRLEKLNKMLQLVMKPQQLNLNLISYAYEFGLKGIAFVAFLD